MTTEEANEILTTLWTLEDASQGITVLTEVTQGNYEVSKEFIVYCKAKRYWEVSE